MVARVKNRFVYANKINEVAPKSNAGVSICKIILDLVLEMEFKTNCKVRYSMLKLIF
jgi:hypothetical protein